MEKPETSIWIEGKPHSKGSIITLPQEVVMSLPHNHMTLKNLFISSYQIWG